MSEVERAARLADLRRIAAMRGDSPQVLFELGNELLVAGQLEEAIGCYRQAISLRGDFADAYNNMGVALRRSGKLEEAILAFGGALNLRLDYADAHNNLGNALCAKEDFDGAIGCFQRAISLRPDFADAHGNLGNALLARGMMDAAIGCYRQALKIRPQSYGIYNNLANALCAKGELAEAMTACRRSLALKPDYAEAHLSLGLMMLLQGDFENGWREYEWRWLSKEHHTPAATFARKRWEGEKLNGRRILLHSEQALGDTLQFARYAPLVAASGGKVILSVQEELVRVLGSMEGMEAVIRGGAPAGDFDVHCPLLSLPGVFRTGLSDIPAEVPYVRAAAAEVEKWKSRVPDDGWLKVGLAWAGRPQYSQDRQRSIALSMFAPLSEVRDVWFVSLQKGEAGKQAANAPMALADWTEELSDFSQTAGLMANLDLVISVDTAVAHLAGAMGKAVWVLLKYIPDWRWMLERLDSPWYPTMRLFRQPAAGDWKSVVRQVAVALRQVDRRSL